LFIITFTLEVYNGASSGVDWHYKCGHIIATLHPNITVDNLIYIYICTCTGIPRFRAYGAVMLVVAAYCWGRKPRTTYIVLVAKLSKNKLLFDGDQCSNSELRNNIVARGQCQAIWCCRPTAGHTKGYCVVILSYVVKLHVRQPKALNTLQGPVKKVYCITSVTASPFP